MSIGGVFKTIGKVVAAPVVLPAKAIKNGTEKLVIKKVITSLVRHGLTAIGGAGVAMSDNEVETIVSALMLLAGLAHSIYEKRKTPTTA